MPGFPGKKTNCPPTHNGTSVGCAGRSQGDGAGFVLGFLAFPLHLPCFKAAVLPGLADQFKGHRQRRAAHMAQAVGQVDAFDRPVLGVVKVPAYQFIFIGVRPFLKAIVKDQYAVLPARSHAPSFSLVARAFLSRSRLGLKNGSLGHGLPVNELCSLI